MDEKTPDAGGLYEEMAGAVEKKVRSPRKRAPRAPVRVGYTSLAHAVSLEVAGVIERTPPQEVAALIDEILRAEKVFFIGVGRVFLSLQCLAKRLAHFGIDCNIVGSVVEKPISSNDLLIVASGSGESQLPLDIARIAKRHGARVALITSAQASSIKQLADIAVHLSAPTKTDADTGVQSIQPMSTLFDQALHLFGDVLCLLLQERTGQTHDDLKRRHANLE